jgi:phosphoribosylformylglycinamidine synthase
VGEEIIHSSHALHLGGLAAGLARIAMGGELGLRVNLDHCADLTALRDDVALFSESAGRALVSAPEIEARRLEELFAGLPCQRIGVVTEAPRLEIRLGARRVIDADVLELKRRWQATLAE